MRRRNIGSTANCDDASVHAQSFTLPTLLETEQKKFSGVMPGSASSLFTLRTRSYQAP